MAYDRRPQDLQCEAFVDVNGNMLCDVAAFEMKLNSVDEIK